MKTKFIFLIVIFAMLLIGCAKPTDQTQDLTKSGDTQEAIDSKTALNNADALLILSIPDWALGRNLTDSPQQPSSNLDSLKALRDFDNVLYKALLSDSTVTYVYTKKFNPCCPCSAGRATCCQCSINTMFAAPRAMNASVKINGTELSSQTKETDNGEVEFFVIPAATPLAGLTLVIDGKGIIAPLQFSMND